MCFTLYFLLILNSTKYDLYYLTLILRNSPILDELLGISPIKFENYFRKIHILDDLKGWGGGVSIQVHVVGIILHSRSHIKLSIHSHKCSTHFHILVFNFSDSLQELPENDHSGESRDSSGRTSTQVEGCYFTGRSSGHV